MYEAKMTRETVAANYLPAQPVAPRSSVCYQIQSADLNISLRAR